MSIKKYGIDLDGVCFNFLDVFRQRLNRKFGALLEREEITNYYWHNNTDKFSEKDFFNELVKFSNSGGFKDLPLMDGTIDALERIDNNGDSIFYITNRHESTIESTIKSLDKHEFPSRHNLYYARGKKSKFINKFGIDVFIEDSSLVIYDILANTDAKVYCVDYPHNRDIINDRVIRIKDWDDFLLEEKL